MIPNIRHSDKMSPDSLYFLIIFGICKERKYYFSSTLSTLSNTKKNRRSKNFGILRFIVPAR